MSSTLHAVTRGGTLYFMPPPGFDLPGAVVEGAVLDRLVEFRGSASAPVRGIVLRGLAFTATRTTFLDPYEPLGRGDWSIRRGVNSASASTAASRRR